MTNQDMAGSAQEYLPGADPALYAYQIARTGGCLTPALYRPGNRLRERHPRRLAPWLPFSPGLP